MTRKELIQKYSYENIRWLIGFIDAEGHFSINTSIKINTINIKFRIKLHKDDIATLKWINNYFFNNIGKIYFQDNYGELVLTGYKNNNIYILPLLDNFPLNTTKYLNFIILKKIIEILSKKEHLTIEGKEKINKLKNNFNFNRKNYTLPNTHKINIDYSWLLGFIEGDDCFTISNYKPAFIITQDGRDLKVLEEIQKFLGCGNIRKCKRKIEIRTTYDFSIISIDYLIDVIYNPLIKIEWHTLKNNDFYKWGIMLKLVAKGYHRIPGAIKVFTHLKNTMNKQRLSTNIKFNYDSDIVKYYLIEELLSNIPPYNLYNITNRRSIRLKILIVFIFNISFIFIRIINSHL